MTTTRTAGRSRKNTPSGDTVMDVVVQCENRLGWAPPGNQPLWRARIAETGKLKKAMSAHGVTVTELKMALEYSWRRRQPITTPLALLFRVHLAKEYADTTKPLSPIAQRIQDAINFELAHPGPGSDYWLGRLARSAGEGRQDTLDEWLRGRAAKAA